MAVVGYPVVSYKNGVFWLCNGNEKIQIPTEHTTSQDALEEWAFDLGILEIEYRFPLGQHRKLLPRRPVSAVERIEDITLSGSCANARASDFPEDLRSSSEERAKNKPYVLPKSKWAEDREMFGGMRTMPPCRTRMTPIAMPESEETPVPVVRSITPRICASKVSWEHLALKLAEYLAKTGQAA